ncbi:ComF family protein [Cellulomonas soli]
MVTTWREIGPALLGLVLPVGCAGCGADDVTWCEACRLLLAGPPFRCEERAGRLDRLGTRPQLPAWALADAVGPVRSLVVSWKDRGRTDLTRGLVGALAAAATHLADEIVAAVAVCPGGAPLLVVPVPSTAAATRRRGTDLVALLADGVARALDGPSGGCGTGARAFPVLRRRGGRDQVGLGRRERAANLAGRVRLARRADVRALDGAPVLLVDDVLTTGATTAQCHDVLLRAGAVVVGLLVLGSAPPSPDPAPRLPPRPGQRPTAPVRPGWPPPSPDSPATHRVTRRARVDHVPGGG